MAFLRALGARVAPRLEPAPLPSDSPHAPPLRKEPIPSLQKEELAYYPDATGLKNDWISPDLETVVANLLFEKRSTVRRKRARALFLALDRAWSDQYAEHALATAAYHYYSWVEEGEVSATWVAELASAPWLSTREDRFRPAAPRDLTVLTEAAFEIEGQHPEKYVHEIGDEHVDSPVVTALQIQGRPFASSIIERLEELPAAELSGTDVDQRWADSCYGALASYVPSGSYEAQSDLSPRQIQAAFRKKSKSGGLIRASNRWLLPDQVRKSPALDESLPTVLSKADPLWDLLGIKRPDASDCVAVMQSLAKRGETNPSGEIRIYRYLLGMEPRQLSKAALKTNVPLGPTRDGEIAGVIGSTR